jgi:hypothetical protein
LDKNTFLIPANSKRGLLILNAFTLIDLIIFGVGLLITIILITTVSPSDLFETILVLLPGMIAALLVTPIPNYHNVLTVLKEAIDYYSQRQNYIWKGWLFREEYNEKE